MSSTLLRFGRYGIQEICLCLKTKFKWCKMLLLLFKHVSGNWMNWGLGVTLGESHRWVLGGWMPPTQALFQTSFRCCFQGGFPCFCYRSSCSRYGRICSRSLYSIQQSHFWFFCSWNFSSSPSLAFCQRYGVLMCNPGRRL